MENFSNMEDNTILYQLDETVTEQIDPFNNEIEIQNMKNQSQFTNLSMNNYYSTCFYSENYHMSDDFSFILNNEDLKLRNSILKRKIQKIPKFKNNERKYSKLEKQKMFYVYKKHRIQCKHKIRKINRNKIRNFVEKDYINFFDDGCESYSIKCKNNFLHEIKKNLYDKNCSRLIEIKKSTNRNFRLFDKDVIIKKIMSNFFKFLKILFELFMSKMLDIKNLKIKEFDYADFYTVEQCKEYLNKHNIFDFFQLNKKITLNFDRKKFKSLLDSNLFQIFGEIFINSFYFFDYLVVKIKSKYDEDYLKCFMNIIEKIISIEYNC